MYKSALAGLSIITIITAITSTPSAYAQEIKTNNEVAVAQSVADQGNEISDSNEKPKKYVVKKNDSLSKIAKKYDTTWTRIFYKNTDIKNPDIIFIDDKLVIPEQDEELKSRPIPADTETERIAPVEKNSSAAKPKARAKSVTKPATVSSPTYVSRGSSSGNLYVPGYCTWYVKNQRPDLPNNLGNADTWVIRARAQGLPTGSTPRAGAVGQRGMHVVYVKSVNRDGSVNISEMNHKGLWVITHRTLPGNYFQYIY